MLKFVYSVTVASSIQSVVLLFLQRTLRTTCGELMWSTSFAKELWNKFPRNLNHDTFNLEHGRVIFRDHRPHEKNTSSVPLMSTLTKHNKQPRVLFASSNKRRFANETILPRLTTFKKCSAKALEIVESVFLLSVNRRSTSCHALIKFNHVHVCL